MKELKPCPFCGIGSELAVVGGDECGWYVECFNCYATGGDAGTRDKAVRLWNTRAERTCTVVGVSNNCVYDEMLAYALSCGHEVEWDDEEPPAFCPECGAKVVNE